MNKQEMAPIGLDERIEIIDVLRGLAIGGILIGNMQWFSGYGQVPESIAAAAPLTDRVVHYLVHFFVEGKFYSIFSFLFGFGFALQISRAKERGDEKASLFKRRLAWLFVIGALHATLLWAGDILSVYAVMGFLLLLFRNKPDSSLLKWAAGLIVVPVFTYLMLYAAFLAFAPPDIGQTVQVSMVEMWRKNTETVAHSSYWEIMSTYNLQYVIGRWIGLVMQMRLPKILALFLLGFYAYRRGFFQHLASHKAFVRKVAFYGFLFGVTGNIIMASYASNEAPFPPTPLTALGVFGYAFGVPALALFFIALVSLLWLHGGVGRNLLAVLAPAGRMALTNYLLQTVTCLIIFYGFGFGRFGTIGATTGTIMAVSIFAAQIVLSTVWLKWFRYGPMEWIWRQLTYGRRLSLLRERPQLNTA